MKQIVGFLIVVLLLGTSLPHPAFAEVTTVAPCDQYVGVANRLVGCIRHTMDATTHKFFDSDHGFYGLVVPIIQAFFFLTVIVYGVLVTTGALQKPAAESFSYAIKLGIVVYLSTHTPLMYQTAMTVVDASTLSMMRLIPSSGSAGYDQDYININCLNALRHSNEVAGEAIMGPWAGMDCLLDTVIGIKPTDEEIVALENNFGKSALGFNLNTDNNMVGLKRGMLYFFFSSMYSSALGVIFAILGLLIAWGLVSLVIRALVTYIGGCLGLAFMMIISPLFLPLLLLKRTFSYFEKWRDLTIGFALQPILCVFFVSVSICVLDLAMFSGSYSLMYKIAGNAALVPGFNLNTYLATNGVLEIETVDVTQLKTTTELAPTAEDNVEGIWGKARKSFCESKILDKITEKLKLGTATEQEQKGIKICDQVMPIRLSRHTMNWNKLAKARTPAVTSLGDGAKTVGEQLSREVLASAILGVLMMFLMNQIAKAAPDLFNNLAGASKQTPDLQGLLLDNINTGNPNQLFSKTPKTAGKR